MRKLRQLWTYPGSKSNLAIEYVKRFPPKFSPYISLFAGTAMDVAIHRLTVTVIVAV